MAVKVDKDKLRQAALVNESLRRQLTATRAALREACEIANRIERDSGDWKPDDADRLAELSKLAEKP